MFEIGEIIRFTTTLVNPPDWFNTELVSDNFVGNSKMLVPGEDNKEGEYGVILRIAKFEDQDAKEQYSYICFSQNDCREYHVFPDELLRVE